MASANKRSFGEIVLAEWMPALITAIIGGLLVAHLAPVIQTKFSELSTFKKRQVEVWESIGENFTNYILWRSRLNAAARGEVATRARGEKLSKEFLERKERYVSERDKYAILLRRDLVLAEYYFGQTVKEQVDAFLSWHAKFAQWTNRLPTRSTSCGGTG